MTQHKAKRTIKIDFLQLPVTQEVASWSFVGPAMFFQFVSNSAILGTWRLRLLLSPTPMEKRFEIAFANARSPRIGMCESHSANRHEKCPAFAMMARSHIMNPARRSWLHYVESPQASWFGHAG